MVIPENINSVKEIRNERSIIYEMFVLVINYITCPSFEPKNFNYSDIKESVTPKSLFFFSIFFLFSYPNTKKREGYGNWPNIFLIFISYRIFSLKNNLSINIFMINDRKIEMAKFLFFNDCCTGTYERKFNLCTRNRNRKLLFRKRGIVHVVKKSSVFYSNYKLLLLIWK